MGQINLPFSNTPSTNRRDSYLISSQLLVDLLFCWVEISVEVKRLNKHNYVLVYDIDFEDLNNISEDSMRVQDKACWEIWKLGQGLNRVGKKSTVESNLIQAELFQSHTFKI